MVKARLEDARFYFHEDLKRKLADRVEDLKGVVFQQKLGSLYEKVQRLKKLALFLADRLGFAQEEKDSLQRAALLAKADLVTDMVKEFPELQGVMGQEYASRDGEKKEVSQAIGEHYRPAFAADQLPETRLGQVLSLADKVDTVCGYFLVGLMPTGSEDPYSLRRQAQAAVKIAFEKMFNFSWLDLLAYSLKLYQEQLDLSFNREVYDKLVEFFEDRVERYWQQNGYSLYTIRSLIKSSLEQPILTNQLIVEVEKLMSQPYWTDILVAYFRAKNLAFPQIEGDVDPSLLIEEEEKILFQEARNCQVAVENGLARKDFSSVFLKLAQLKPVIDRFFDSVLVMAEDNKVRENRLKLLNFIVALFEKMADFSVFPKIL